MIGAGIHRQAERAIDEADAVAARRRRPRRAVTPIDRELAEQLRSDRQAGVPARSTRSTAPSATTWSHEFHELGLGEPFPISAAHGRGIDDAARGDRPALVPTRRERRATRPTPTSAATLPDADDAEEPARPSRAASANAAARRLRRPPERRQVVADEPPARRGALAGPPRRRAPPPIRSTPRSRSAAATTCWSTPPASAARRGSRSRHREDRGVDGDRPDRARRRRRAGHRRRARAQPSRTRGSPAWSRRPAARS